MVLGTVHLGVSLRLATVVVPVALYFLILGLLNSRRSPQLLRGRRDFALMLAALGPLFLVPLLGWVQSPHVALAVLGLAAAAAFALLAPPRASWVIYNIEPAEAARAVAGALREAGLAFHEADGGFGLSDGGTVRVSPFPLLRNVSVRMAAANRATARRFEKALTGRVHSVPAETTPMAMALLLVATAMLVAPLAMVAPRAGEIVRILTGMLY